MLLERQAECRSIKRARHRGASCHGHAVQLGQANSLETLEPSFNCFTLFFVATLEDFSLQDLSNLGVHYKTLCLQILASSTPALRWLDYGRMFKMLPRPWF